MIRLSVAYCCAFVFGATLLATETDVRVQGGGRVCLPGYSEALVPFIRTINWRVNSTPVGGMGSDAEGMAACVLAANNMPYADCMISAKNGKSGSVRVDFGCKCRRDILNCLWGVRLKLPADMFKGSMWRLGDKTGMFPENKGSVGSKAKGRRLELAMPDGRRYAFAFDSETEMEWIDNRNWGSDAFIVSFGRLTPCSLSNGDKFSIGFAVSDDSGKPLGVRFDGRYVVKEGKEWVKVDYVKDIIPDSALDFSKFSGPCSGPAGRHGWLKNVNGHFEFERLPGARQRFYGVNLCSDANYPDAALVDEVVDRLVRLGYNSIRFHHHDGVWRANRYLFDYFMYRAIEKGLYITTDLYVSRRIKWRDVGIDRNGEMPSGMYKALCIFHEGTYADFTAYVRDFMGHVNPHTGRRYADEPGMPLISVINEGALDGIWSKLNSDPLFADEWKRWTGANPKSGMLEYMADRERVFMNRFRRFWHDELKAKALLTNQNRGPYSDALNQVKRDCYGYVDRHFYRGHPKFPMKSWRLPSSVGHGNPLKDRKFFLEALSDARLKELPFVVSEWNCGAPASFRALGALAFGAYAASNGWDGAWRFAYSHRAEKMREGAHVMSYFDLATDPLNQASDRAAIALFLRGDGMDGNASMRVDPAVGALAVSTPLTCGVYLESGSKTAGSLSCNVHGAPANVSAISLDGKPLAESKRILLAHLTDVQADGAVFADSTRTLLIDWGKGGCLARVGAADVALKVENPENYVVYALGTEGRRKCTVPSHIVDGRISFTCSVRQSFGACLYYEISAINRYGQNSAGDCGN